MIRKPIFLAFIALMSWTSCQTDGTKSAPATSGEITKIATKACECSKEMLDLKLEMTALKSDGKDSVLKTRYSLFADLIKKTAECTKVYMNGQVVEEKALHQALVNACPQLNTQLAGQLAKLITKPEAPKEAPVEHDTTEVIPASSLNQTPAQQ